ncbi:MAG: hypothetical protein HY327_03010 [Chloroflexi bacterium]|nr:hypothetical protein [Chloroflexota bacterium]
MPSLEQLASIDEQEFPDIVESTSIIRDKLRVVLIDESFIDFWWSSEIDGRFACHWERTHVDGKHFRHNNMPHAKWKSVKTFPKHFHDGDTGEVIESFLSEDPEGAVREFLGYARGKLGG